MYNSAILEDGNLFKRVDYETNFTMTLLLTIPDRRQSKTLIPDESRSKIVRNRGFKNNVSSNF